LPGQLKPLDHSITNQLRRIIVRDLIGVNDEVIEQQNV
jgi:hypothetical protein